MGLLGKSKGWNTPINYTALIQALGPAAWYRYGQGITLTSNGVSQWDDQSGNGRHLLQGTANNRPQLGGQGANLITNGTFDTNADGWTGFNAALSVVSGRLRVTHDSAGNSGGAYQALTTQVGKRYTVFVDYAVDGITGNVFVGPGTSPGSMNVAANNIGSTLGRHAITFEAVGTTTYINLVTSTAAQAGETADFDNVVVQEADESIYFDGLKQFLKTDAFTLNQPETTYLLMKQITWPGTSAGFTDGIGVGQVSLYQSGVSPQIAMYAGSSAAINGNLPLNSFGVVAAVFDGAASLLQVDNTTPTTGNPGTANPGGFTLGAASDAPAQFGNIQVAEAIIFPAAHSADTRARVIEYLNTIKAQL